jgi:hypothetical protein
MNAETDSLIHQKSHMHEISTCWQFTISDPELTPRTAESQLTQPT